MESLYELSEQIRNFEFKIDEETGEVLNVDELNQINMKFDEKAENIIKYIKNLDAEAQALKNEEDSIKGRRQAKERKIESLRRYLSGIMQANDRQKIEFTSGVATFRKSNVVEVDDKFLTWARMSERSEFLNMKLDINKGAIKEALKNGEALQFAHLVEKNNLQIK